MKKVILISISVLIVILAILFVFVLPKETLIDNQQNQEAENQEGKLIGGQTDEHGCLGPAGYSWCESKQSCLRIWEESCDDSILSLVNEVQSESGVIFDKLEKTEFEWRVEGETGVEVLKLSGLKFSKSEVTSDEYTAVAQYFESHYQTSLENAAGGVMGGLEGFVINYDVCVLGYEFTRSTQSSEGPIIPDTGSREMTLNCGWLDKNLMPIISDEKKIKELFAEKYNKKVSTIDVNIQKTSGEYARGSVKFWDDSHSYGEGGIWLAYKTGENWNLAFDGNGMFECQAMQDFGFPEDLIEDCYAGE